jgi:hypothetical protein
MTDPLFNKLLPQIMKEIFNLVTVDDFVEVRETKTSGKITSIQLVIGNGKGGKRLLTASEAAEFIEAVKELDRNAAFQSIINQARYKGQETQAASQDWDAAVFPKGILYAADLFKRVVDAVKILQVAKNEQTSKKEKGAEGRN